MKPTYPLQTGPNCVACAFAGAIETCLAAYPPEYHRRVTPAEVEAIVGAPADIRVAAQKIMESWYWVHFTELPYPNQNITLENGNYPIVAATWRDNISHAVCLLDRDMEYDPAKAAIQHSYGRFMMGSHRMVILRKPPVINKWRRYAVYRWVEQLFNLGV